MAQYEDLEVDQGADAKWRLKLLESDGTKRDLTDYTARGKLNRSYDADSSEAVSFSVSFLSPRSDGIIEFSLTNTQTETLTRRRYVYDIEIEYEQGGDTLVERVLEGKLMVSKSVTK